MYKSSKRSRRIADVIQHELAPILQRKINDPRLADVSITAVEVSVDLGHARIYFTLLDKSKLNDVNKAFHKASGYIRHLIAENSELRFTPELMFVFDETLERAEKMTTLIDRALREDEKMHGKPLDDEKT